MVWVSWWLICVNAVVMTGLVVVWFDICCMIFVWIVVTHLLRASLGCWVLVWLFCVVALWLF